VETEDVKKEQNILRKLMYIEKQEQPVGQVNRGIARVSSYSFPLTKHIYICIVGYAFSTSFN
jgi:hypothetical protein